MRLVEKTTSNPEEEAVILVYKDFSKEFSDIKDYILGKKNFQVYLKDDNTIAQIRVEDILYFEAMGNLVFAYTRDKIYDVKMRLYQIEKQLSTYNIMRASKSFLINLYHIKTVSPAFNGRLIATMDNSEEVMISRQYAKTIAECIMNGLD